MITFEISCFKLIIQTNLFYTEYITKNVKLYLPKRIFRNVLPNKQRNVGPRTESNIGASESAPVTKSMSSTLL